MASLSLQTCLLQLSYPLKEPPEKTGLAFSALVQIPAICSSSFYEQNALISTACVDRDRHQDTLFSHTDRTFRVPF